jgi:hypothetical protein
MAHTNIQPPQSKLLSAPGLFANQSDLLAMQNRIKGDQRHLQMVLKGGKLFGPMTQEQQIEAVQYAYGIRGIIKK